MLLLLLCSEFFLVINAPRKTNQEDISPLIPLSVTTIIIRLHRAVATPLPPQSIAFGYEFTPYEQKKCVLCSPFSPSAMTTSTFVVAVVDELFV